MSEIAFTKQFLSTLASRPVRLQSSHVEDPRHYSARSAYILPKMANRMKKQQKHTSRQEILIDVSLKSLRNPPLDILLLAQPLSTSVLDLKHAVAERCGLATDKIKLLAKRKPSPDSKSLKDLVPPGTTEIEFSIMVMGGNAASSSVDASPAADVIKNENTKSILAGEDVLVTHAFWDDLEGFLIMRIRDEKSSKRVLEAFKKAWETIEGQP
ncbi:MAG: hypothetical protein M1829_005789 [Trizodia sp. TS-e1964]|nr:MAG: hypothetical protein M1829_005789 [Trizodia sp. TS-e1964]